jgi:chemotaxis protein CheD
MIKSRDPKSDKTIYILYPGEYFASKEKCLIGTVTGSCVIVCLHDKLKRLGGMCFLVVPGALGTEGIFNDDIAAQGVTQLEYLLGELVKLGGDRRNLTAKIFGAATFSKNYGKDIITMGLLKFIDQYFKYEKIPVYSDDLGGTYRRKIYFSPTDGKVFRKILINNNESSEFIKMEYEYINSVFNKKEKYGKVILFE